MAIAFLIGRIIVGLFYLMVSINHFTNSDQMAGYATSKGVPTAKLAVQGTGVLLLLAGLSILTGYQPLIAVILLVIFYLPVTFMMHNFWTIEDPQAKMADMVNFNKNMALLGSALMLLAIPTPWPFGLG